MSATQALQFASCGLVGVSVCLASHGQFAPLISCILLPIPLLFVSVFAVSGNPKKGEGPLVPGAAKVLLSIYVCFNSVVIVLSFVFERVFSWTFERLGTTGQTLAVIGGVYLVRKDAIKIAGLMWGGLKGGIERLFNHG